MPAGGAWTPQAVAWMVIFVATGLGLPALISAVVIPAMQTKPAAQADLSNVAARSASDRADLAQELDKLRQSCGPAVGKVSDLESQQKGILARLDAIEKSTRPRKPKAVPVANTPSAIPKSGPGPAGP